ncbi:MAG: hypothetical protein QNJ46_35025 [Leptolyngbyaceae cyanobacterium MO_188.B28]|nr:hypothetical protein [Leptolyngbyaceae cyanobacterium MO_188.B28]
MATKRLNAKNTKAEILTAYNELAKANKLLEGQLTVARKTIPESTLSQNGQSQATLIKEPVYIERSSSMQQPEVESIIEALNRLQLNFGGAASTLSEQLISEVLKLQEIQASVAEEAEQLETLHNLQVSDGGLTQLIEEYETSSRTFQEEYSQTQEELDLELAQAKKTWEQAQEDRRRAVKERNDLQTKLRHRNTKEYLYNLTLQNKLSDDEYEQDQKQRYWELEEFQEAQEKQWGEREKAIAEREKEFEDLKNKVDGFPEKLEKALKKAKEEGKGIAHHQAKIKADLAAQAVEGQKAAYKLRIEALQDSISTQNNRIENLSNQLNAALQQVQDLAVKAIEGAANLSSLKSIREIAIEQAKNPSKGK